MAATTDKSKKLPKELQDYKRGIKKQPFMDRVKAYFDCAPFVSDIDSQKKEIILSTFSKNEREEFNRKYLPIHSSIERYGDRIRAINGNRIIYTLFIENSLREKDYFKYTADFLNLVLPNVREALENTKEENTKETLKETISILRTYRRVSIQAPKIEIGKEGNYKILKEADKERYLRGAVETLKGILSLQKCYLESLKEFLEWVGTPDLFSKEFEYMENDLLSRYNGNPGSQHKNPDDEKFPNFFEEEETREEYLSINYKELPLSVDIFGQNNLFANSYRSFFNY